MRTLSLTIASLSLGLITACGPAALPRSPLEAAIEVAQLDLNEAFELGLDASRQVTPLRILTRWNPPPAPDADAQACSCSLDFPFELRLQGRWHRFVIDRNQSRPEALDALNAYRAGTSSQFPNIYLIGELQASPERCPDTGQFLPVLVLEAIEPVP